MTAKQLEQETGCKIMVRGKGSMRDKKKVSSRSLLIKIMRFLLVPLVRLCDSFAKGLKLETESAIAAL